MQCGGFSWRCWVPKQHYVVDRYVCFWLADGPSGKRPGCSGLDTLHACSSQRLALPAVHLYGRSLTRLRAQSVINLTICIFRGNGHVCVYAGKTISVEEEECNEVAYPWLPRDIPKPSGLPDGFCDFPFFCLC